MAPGRRERLTRTRVVDAAMTLADDGGLEALSMRRLAEHLGVVPMALYRHVADKHELLDAMIDRVFAELTDPVDPDWAGALRARARSMRDALARHPWAIGRMETGTPGPANLAHHNAVMGCLRAGARLPFWDAVHASSLLDSYVYGFALQDRTLAGDIPAEAARRREVVVADGPAALDAYPYLAEVADQLGRHGYDFAQEFAVGLDLVLDAIRGLRPVDDTVAEGAGGLASGEPGPAGD